MIKIIDGSYEWMKFPAGEQHVVIKEVMFSPVNILFEYENDSEIFKLCLLVDAIKHNGYELGSLEMPYVPFARQDRVAQRGEPLSIKVFSDIINNLNFTTVVITDPHSDVTTALINRCIVIPQHNYYFKANIKGKHYLISPDGGSLKKIRKCITEETIDIIECSKKRSVKTGFISKTIVHHDEFKGEKCVIVDDICDGGRTFVEIAKVLKSKGAGEIVLYVTHGLFTKGLGVFDNLIDRIYTKKGDVK